LRLLDEQLPTFYGKPEGVDHKGRGTWA